MNFHIFTCFFTIYGYITSSQHDQLPVGLIVQLVEYCASIAEVVVSDPVRARIFFGLLFHNCLKCVYNCDNQCDVGIVSWFAVRSNFSTPPRGEGRDTLRLMTMLSIKTIWELLPEEIRRTPARIMFLFKILFICFAYLNTSYTLEKFFILFLV